MPKLNRCRKKGSPDPLAQVVGFKEWERIIKTPKATEGYVLSSSIAMGAIQMLCLKYGADIRVSSFRYMRTPSKDVMSEASMMGYLRRNFFRFMGQKPELSITKIITSKQIPPEDEEKGLLISRGNF